MVNEVRVLFLPLLQKESNKNIIIRGLVEKNCRSSTIMRLLGLYYREAHFTIFF